jgi:hypothetical protein
MTEMNEEESTTHTDMKSILSVFLVLETLVWGCATHERHPPMPIHATTNSPAASVNAAEKHPDQEDLPLFVHLISPRYYTDPPTPPKLIASTRINLGKDFAVGHTGSGYSFSVGGADPFGYSGDAVLAGRVERRGDVYWGRLLGCSNGTVNNFAGQMKLEHPVDSQGAFFSGGIWSVRFVLSTNSDCREFLKE